MKVTEIKYARRYNVGNYEHEEYSVLAILDEGDSMENAVSKLKQEVAAAHAGQAAYYEDAPAEKEEEETEAAEETEAEETEAEEEVDEGNEEGAEAEEDEAEESDDEESSESSEDSEDEEPKVKARGASTTKSKKTSAGGATSKATSTSEKSGETEKKKFKKKPQVYQRTNETHKEIFSNVLKAVAPDWKKSDKTKAKAKDVSLKMEGKDFLDETGEVIPAFRAAVKKLMDGKKK